MREIMFRGKLVDNSGWVYGYYRTNELGNHFITQVHKNNGEYCFDEVEVDAETIGQYTGLKDKNGIEIYEGDIVYEIISENKGVVTFSKDIGSCGCCFSAFSGSGFVGISIDKTQEDLRISYEEDIEVIGNIHEDE